MGAKQDWVADKRLHGDCYAWIESNMKKNQRLDEPEIRERIVYDDRVWYPPEVFNQKIRQCIWGDIRRIMEGGELELPVAPIVAFNNTSIALLQRIVDELEQQLEVTAGKGGAAASPDEQCSH